MTATLERPPADLAGGNGGRPARRAMVRWAWRLFRREWRQQALVLALLTLAVAATTVGVALATTATHPAQATFSLPGSDPQLASDVAAFQARFGDVEVIRHQPVAVPGSVATIDVRDQDPGPTHHRPTLRLVSGRYPSGPSEVAMTAAVARLFDLSVGGTWSDQGRALTVVGLVENPEDLHDRFALVAPGQVAAPESVTIAPASGVKGWQQFHLPSGAPLTVMVESATAKAAAAATVLALATMCLLFVGLVAVAGFTVMAQRRLRALGMLASLGATDRHVRLVMLANGAAVGAAGAVVGSFAGVAGWLALGPRLETVVGHRIDRWALPWWAIGAAMGLAVLTAVVAAWWPARSVARIPVVTALSGRPPRPQPSHRFAASGAVLLAAGAGLLAQAHERRAGFVLSGTVATVLGMLLLAPLAIRVLAAAARRAPVPVRLALRDLARYSARSGAALGAIALAIAIAATIAVSAAAQMSIDAAGARNLPDNQLLVYGSLDGDAGLLPALTPAQVQAIQATVDQIGTALGSAQVVPLEAAVSPTAPDIPRPDGGPSGKPAASLVKVGNAGPRGGVSIERIAPLYVATPALLAHYGISPAQVDPTADVLTSRRNIAGLSVGTGGRGTIEPKVQLLDLPPYSSAPNAVITTHAMDALGLQAVPAAWLLQTPKALTAAQIDAARRLAAPAGLVVETTDHRSLAQLGHWATGAGLFLALGVLAMTVGLIRSETAHDLRILTAAGAGSRTRRTVTAATAGALALLGALLGTGGAYLALVAWYHRHLHPLTSPPGVDLAVILVGLPLVASAAGWLLAGREPPAIARRPIE